MPCTNSSLAGETIGFIGLGLMGKPMARNLHAAGAQMVLHSRSLDQATEFFTERAVTAKTPSELARQVDTIILMLTDTDAVETVISGKYGILEGLKAGSLVIDMGTSLMTTTKKLAGAVMKLGGSYLDAPVSGGTSGAENGTLTIMVGGEIGSMVRAQPLFEVLGSKTTHVGATGAGQIAKAVNQVVVGLTIGAVAEGLSLARRAGIDATKVYEALSGGFAASRILEVHGKRMLKGQFTPGAKIMTQRKDLEEAISLASELGLELQATELNLKLYDELIAAGNAGLDHSALILAIDPEAI